MNCDLKSEEFVKMYTNRAVYEPDCLIFDLANQFFSNGTSPRLKCPQSVPKDYVSKPFQPVKNLSCFPYCDVCITGTCAACKTCVGSTSSECAHCFKTEAPNKGPCLSTKANACEICWKNQEEEEKEK